jgi:hypothetical protein
LKWRLRINEAKRFQEKKYPFNPFVFKDLGKTLKVILIFFAKTLVFYPWVQLSLRTLREKMH